MHQPRLVRFIFGACVALSSLTVVAQTPPAPSPAQASNVSIERLRGLELYRRGDIEGAIKVLQAAVKRDEDDAEAWRMLGLARHRQGNLKEARRAFAAAVKLRPDDAPARAGLAYMSLLNDNPGEAEREAEHALRLDPQHAEAHYVSGAVRLRKEELPQAVESAEAALKSNPNFAPAYLLKSQALIEMYALSTSSLIDEARGGSRLNEETVRRMNQGQSARLKEAADNLEQYLRLTPNAADAATWREQLETLRVYARPASYATDAADTIYPSKDLTQRAVILSKPSPALTEEARQAKTQGVVRLRLVLSSDGTVRHILALRSLPHGLTHNAIQAARRMRFTPAMRNGVPVSQYVIVEYNFDVR